MDGFLVGADFDYYSTAEGINGKNEPLFSICPSILAVACLAS